MGRAYERDRNRRIDKANKAMHEILSNNDFLANQDEMINSWQAGLFGKQMQYSAMGYIKAKLKNNSCSISKLSKYANMFIIWKEDETPIKETKL